jgi:hypothetical protein
MYYSAYFIKIRKTIHISITCKTNVIDHFASHYNQSKKSRFIKYYHRKQLKISGDGQGKITPIQYGDFSVQFAKFIQNYGCKDVCQCRIYMSETHRWWRVVPLFITMMARETTRNQPSVSDYAFSIYKKKNKRKKKQRCVMKHKCLHMSQIPKVAIIVKTQGQNVKI